MTTTMVSTTALVTTTTSLLDSCYGDCDFDCENEDELIQAGFFFRVLTINDFVGCSNLS